MRCAVSILAVFGFAIQAVAEQAAEMTCRVVEETPVTQLAAVGTYDGQQLEFRVTLDGKPVDLKKPDVKETAAACKYTS